MTKISYISPQFRHFSFFFWESKWSRSDPISVKPFCISQTSRTVSLKNPRFLQSPFYFLFIFFKTIPYINSETNPPSPIFNVVCKYLIQFLGTSFSSATLPICCNIGKGLIYFCKVDHSRISRNFSGNWLGPNTLYEILWACNFIKKNLQNWCFIKECH